MAHTNQEQRPAILTVIRALVICCQMQALPPLTLAALHIHEALLPVNARHLAEKQRQRLFACCAPPPTLRSLGPASKTVNT